MSENKFNLTPAEIFVFLAKQYKTLLVFILLFGSVFAIYGKFLANDYFKVPSIVQNTVYSASSSGNSNPFSAIADLGGGWSLGGQASLMENEMVMIKKIQTRYFFNQLVVQDPTIRYKIFAAKNYDFENKKIIYYKRIYDSESKKWNRNVKPEAIHRYFLKSLSIKYSIEDGLIYISYEHPSPFFAKELIESIVNLFNDSYRVKVLSEADESINVLNKEMSMIQSPLLSNNTASLIQNHIQEKIFARVKPALTYVEPPYIPNRTESWRTGLWLLMGILVGFVVGSFYLLKSKLNFNK